MEIKAYAIYDKVALAYNRPMYFHNDGMALRAVQAEVNNTESYINKSPEDFILFQVGEFNDETGYLNTTKTGPRRVVILSELVNKDHIEKKELEKLASEMKGVRAIVESLKTLVVGKEQAS